MWVLVGLLPSEKSDLGPHRLQPALPESLSGRGERTTEIVTSDLKHLIKFRALSLPSVSSAKALKIIYVYCLL